jgi:hypothetical protein
MLKYDAAGSAALSSVSTSAVCSNELSAAARLLAGLLTFQHMATPIASKQAAIGNSFFIDKL